MKPSAVRHALAQEKKNVETTLRRLLRTDRSIPRRLARAMAHSLFSGGKRLRPALLLWTYDALRQDRRRLPAGARATAVDAAAAFEMLHTYSLIHDDLPAMDDDVLRRGQPTCHVAFDEGTAILAGDGLQALAFAVLARLPSAVAPAVIRRVAEAVGPAGMVGGQQDDLDSEGQPVTAAVVGRIHRRKTAALIAAAMTAGAQLAGAGTGIVTRVHEAGIALGLAFQGTDDLLDITASSEVLGKSAGKDQAAGKATWVRVEGIERARRRTNRHGRQGMETLAGVLVAGTETDRLLGLLRMLWQRDR